MSVYFAHAGMPLLVVTLMSKTNSGTQNTTTQIKNCWLPSTVLGFWRNAKRYLCSSDSFFSLDLRPALAPTTRALKTQTWDRTGHIHPLPCDMTIIIISSIIMFWIIISSSIIIIRCHDSLYPSDKNSVELMSEPSVGLIKCLTCHV